MPDIRKEKSDRNNQKKDAPEEGTWGEDQKKHDYYYDDSHGYEVYDPATDDDEEPESNDDLFVTD
jgi:hypothetical protein